MTIYRDPNATVAKASPVANAMPAVSTSDTFTIKFRRLNDNIILEVFNNATGQSYCNRYLVPTTGLAFNYMFYAALFAVSGTNSVKVTRFEVCDMGYKRPKSLFIGDLELYGYGFSSLYNGVNYRYFTVLQNEAKGLLVANGIPGSRASHWNRAEVYESLDLYKPEILTIALGLNVIAGGASAATAYAAVKAIIDRYKTSCIINIINISPLGSAVAGYVALNTTIDTVNASLLANTDVAHVFDINTLLKNGGSDLHASYDSGDGTHWNHKAHLDIKNLIIAANIY